VPGAGSNRISQLLEALYRLALERLAVVRMRGMRGLTCATTTSALPTAARAMSTDTPSEH